MGVVDFATGGNAVLVYPNPLEQNAVFEYTLVSEENLSLNVFDASGKLVKTVFGGK